MRRRKFISIAGGAVIAAGTTGYLLSDKSNFVRSDTKQPEAHKINFRPDEREIMLLSSLAPSGHNAQPWFIYLEPYHWLIGNDKNKWLMAVDPAQRETILSIGAFMQNMFYAARQLGYDCNFTMVGLTNQDDYVTEVKLFKTSKGNGSELRQILNRRTVRANLLTEKLKTEDLNGLIADEPDDLHFLARGSKEYYWLNDQTIEANRIQSYRDPAQKELADWIRFSSKAAKKYEDGLTTASMEMDGFKGWVLRNFYGKASVMQTGFIEQGINNVVKQVGQSAGWLLITSKNNTVPALIETGMRMQRLFLKVRDKSIAIHPMTQILEETTTKAALINSIRLNGPIQFILRGLFKKLS